MKKPFNYIFFTFLLFNVYTMAQSTQEELIMEYKNKFNEQASPEIKALYVQETNRLKNEHTAQKSLKIGDKAIDFKLKDWRNQEIVLSDLINLGPVVLVWYRGGWCPYCNISLSSLQKILVDLKKLNATLLAITPELPDHTLATTEKNKLEFKIVSDINNEVAKKYGIVFRLTDKVAEKYQTAFQLHQVNGNNSNELPMPATFIIDKNGIIQYAFVDEDYTKRASPEMILDILKKLL